LSFFLARLGLITGARLASWRRHAFVAAFIIGAMLTPPDVISQLALAVPFILLYEVSILVARLSSRR
ncbi:MAG: twin-arginine translocase subunit TatC, partial [Porticoccaceae bacterium]